MQELAKLGVSLTSSNVHRTVSVGKKMFTWAYNQLSRSWEKALTDTDGACAELMASSYSLNQPDFAWLMPYDIAAFLMAEANPRDDIVIELCRALCMAGEYERALDIPSKKTFTPCEGGEHAVAEPYMFAHHALGRRNSADP